MALTQTVFCFWGIDLGTPRGYDDDYLYDGWREKWQEVSGEPATKRHAVTTCRVLLALTEGTDGRAFALVSASMRAADPWKHSAFDTPVVDDSWREKLRSFTAALGLPWREPSWIIACEWSP